MDYVGQARADWIHQIITAIFGIVGFVYGYFTQSFGNTMYISMAGLALSALICVPDWPCLNRNKPKWVSVDDEGGEDEEDEGDDGDQDEAKDDPARSGGKGGGKGGKGKKKGPRGKKSKKKGKK